MRELYLPRAPLGRPGTQAAAGEEEGVRTQATRWPDPTLTLALALALGCLNRGAGDLEGQGCVSLSACMEPSCYAMKPGWTTWGSGQSAFVLCKEVLFPGKN